MFGKDKKVAELEQRVRTYHSALERIARHADVAAFHGQPEQMAATICSKIDLLRKKSPTPAMPDSETRPIHADVRKIKLSGAVDVVVQQGDEPKMEVFANDAKDLHKIITRVSGDCLTVDNEPMTILTSSGDVSKIISVGNGNRVAGRDYFEVGSRDIRTPVGATTIRSNSAEKHTEALCFRVEVTLPKLASLHISGAGDINYLNVEQDELNLDVSGVGTITVAGTVNRLEADVSGAGNISAYRLFATHARLRVSGAGNIKATATASVVARVSGVGNIKIKGNPKERDTDVSGMGRIRFSESDD
jgi:hypothetical protein